MDIPILPFTKTPASFYLVTDELRSCTVPTMGGTAIFHHHCLLHHHYPHTLSSSSSSSSIIITPKLTSIKCALTKQGQRFLTSIATLPLSLDPSATHRLIHKFASSSSKSVTLSTLNHLLSPHSTSPRLCYVAFPLYLKITQLSWFSWNSKLVASVIAFLYKQGQLEEAEYLISESVSNFCSKERDLISLYCNLIDSHAKLKSEDGFSTTFALLKEMSSRSSSIYVRRRAYESMIGGLCVIGQPHEARNLINEMRQLGIKPSLYEFRSIIEGYGRLGLFEEMLRGVADMESSGFPLDRISSNMVLLSYGLHNDLSQMILWLRKVKVLGIGSSIRTYNSVLNSCTTVISLLQDLKTVPISLEELFAVLRGDETLLIQELVGSLDLDEIFTWTPLELKLDLHGMHLSTSYVVMLQWMEELHCRFTSGEYKIPAEVMVVCGSGKHSSVRGDSPVKALVREMMHRTKSPMRVDRKNIGCFIAKGRSVKDWLC